MNLSATPPAPEPGIIRMYLPEGTPDGLRVIEKAGWIGSAALFPRTRFPQLRSRPEMKRTGVYILLGDETGQEPQQRRRRRRRHQQRHRS